MSLSNTFKNQSQFSKGNIVEIDGEYLGELLFEISAGYWAVEVETDDGHKRKNVEENRMQKVSK